MVFVVVLQPCYLWKRTFLKVCRDCVLGRGDPSTVGWSTKQPVAHKSNPTRDLLNIASRSQWIKVSGALTNRHNIFHRHLLPSSFFSFSPLPSSPSPLFLLLLLLLLFFLLFFLLLQFLLLSSPRAHTRKRAQELFIFVESGRCCCTVCRVDWLMPWLYHHYTN